MNWIKDTPKVREYDGRTLNIVSNEQDKGVYKMYVLESDPQGNKRPGFVLLVVEPYDLTAALATLDGKHPIDSSEE